MSFNFKLYTVNHKHSRYRRRKNNVPKEMDKKLEKPYTIYNLLAKCLDIH